jgi:exonuclease I
MKRIKNSLKEKQELFVIHNLQNCYKKEQVDDYIENTLKKLFGLKIQENNFFDIDKNLYQKYFIETDKDVTHLIFVNDYCDIAEYYNKAAYEFIKSKLKGVRERTYFSVVEKCKEFFIEKHDRFLLETINKKDLHQEDDALIVKNKKIELKKVYIDEIGDIILKKMI